MRMFRRTLLLAAALTFSPVVYAAENAFDIDAYIDNANVLVGDESYDFCSGTVIDAERRFVLTAYHCVADKMRREEVETVDPVTGEISKKTIQKKLEMVVSQNVTRDYEKISRRSYVAKIWRGDRENDVAILQVVDTEWKPSYVAKLAPDDYKIRRGEKVFIVGNPGVELDNSITQGIVSATERTLMMDGKKWRVFQTDAQAIGGNSGGSVLNEKGEMIGTLSAGIRGTSITFVIPISATKKMIKDGTPPAAGPGGKMPGPLSFFVHSTGAGEFTREMDVAPMKGEGYRDTFRGLLRAFGL